MMTLRPLALALALTASPSLAGDDPWIAPADEAAKENPVAVSEEVLAGARAVYADKCQMCHGPEGLGDGPSRAFISVPPGDLSSVAVQDQSDGALYWKITKGRRPMIGFRRKLNDEERWSLVLLVRTFAIVPEEETDAAASDPENTEKPAPEQP